jgi:hypothetical protein
MKSRYYSTRQADRREWQKLQRQLKYGFPDPRQLYPEDDDNFTWYVNFDPTEELGPGSEFLRFGEPQHRCWTRGNRRSQRWAQTWRRKRTRHWGAQFDYQDRCHICFNFFGWNKKDYEKLHGDTNGF